MSKGGHALLVFMFILSFLVVPLFAASASAAEDLRNLLPGASIQKGIKTVGELVVAKGEALFQVINGGAALFFRHHFRQAVFQEYRMAGGKIINLEIYQMSSEADAEEIFDIKKDMESQPIDIGQKGSMAGYYGIFRQGAYFIAITGGDSTETTRKTLISIARMIIKKLEQLPAR